MMLPSDVLIEILSRLSPKTLCKLKAVSKHWLNTISTHHFKKLHSQRSRNKPHLLVVNESMDDKHSFTHTLTISTLDHLTKNNPTTQPPYLDKKFSLDDLFQHDYTYFSFSHCLICYNTQNRIWVHNPSTHQNRVLPLVSNPTISFELGYVPSSNVFKILHLFGTNDDESADYRVGYEIITLEDGDSVPSSWRGLDQKNQTLYRGPHHNTSRIASMSVNGAIYWLVYDMEENRKRIASFDLENEQFISISCPFDSSTSRVSLVVHQAQQLMDIKGDFGFAQFSESFSDVNIFVHKQCQGKNNSTKDRFWVKEFSINLSGLGQWFKIVGYVPLEGEINGEILFLPNNGKPLLYNIMNGSFRDVGDTSLLKCRHHYIYFDSLFCLGST